MRIRWLNSDCTEAELTRGLWWWKRKAFVSRRVDGSWHYVSGREFWDFWVLNRCREAELARVQYEEDWPRVDRVPAMKLLERET